MYLDAAYQMYMNYQNYERTAGLESIYEEAQADRAKVWVYIDKQGQAYASPPEDRTFRAKRVSKEVLKSLLSK
jgi:hypothetical protein